MPVYLVKIMGKNNKRYGFLEEIKTKVFCNNQLPKSHRRLTLSHQSNVLLNSATVLERVNIQVQSQPND